MIDITISEEIKALCPDFAGAAICATIINSPSSDELWSEIDETATLYSQTHSIEDIKKNPAIAATRDAYKLFGKDPNRYRPSAEALCRRILRGIPLYRVDTLVDLVNLVSIKTGYSIGGFDTDKIEGKVLTLGIGKEGEPYEGIGKGELNIAGLPVYRDATGGIGTPTSDNERTKLSLDTTHFLAIINGYSGRDGLSNAVIYMQNLLAKYVQAKDITHYYF